MSNTNQGTDILDFAARLCGEDRDSEILAALCAAAGAELEARLREGCSGAELGERFTAAAGILALSMYCALEQPGRLRSFRAGDVSAEYGGAGDADALRAVAERMLAGYLRDRGFGFAGVQG
ncbi:MAG: hypothetical protein E7472_05250 [Ruminococcaceae bacterium]|nr:hypothetical protein [Oscillospiraceae bacterium]